MSVTLTLLALDLPPIDIAALARLLGPAERARADRYRFARDATRFIARRGQLRLLLGQVMEVAPDRLPIEHDAVGRPFVAGGPVFSIASSGALGLCAITNGGPIGCDIEHHDTRLADRAIAERLFAPGERRALAALPAPQWRKGFFDCWTRKEAVVKALGTGLSHPLDIFRVPIARGGGGTLPPPYAALRIDAFDTVPDFSIAVCAAADDRVDTLCRLQSPGAVAFRSNTPRHPSPAW